MHTAISSDIAAQLLALLAALMLVVQLLLVVQRMLLASIRLFALQSLFLAGIAAVVAYFHGAIHVYVVVVLTIVGKVLFLPWLLDRQDAHGRWKNQAALNGKTWVDFEPQGAPSKWVTLRACRVLRLAG